MNTIYCISTPETKRVTIIVAIRTAVRIETICYTDFGPNRYILLCGLRNISQTGAGVKCEVRGARCEVVKCEVPVRGINARRWVICEAGMCEAQRTTGAKGVVVGCETLKRN